MTTRNSKIYICAGIRMDRSYSNVLSYTEAQMLSLCQSKAIASSSNYSFIRNDKNAINTSFTYNQCLSSNYVAFQNPSYSNKWFFAWIDEVEYVSDTVTRITYVIDAWSTWYEKFPKQACLVQREHVSSDSYGANRQPEPISVSGEYQDYNKKYYNLAPNGLGVKINATGSTGGDIVGSANGATYSGLFRIKLRSTYGAIATKLGSLIEDYTGNDSGTNIVDIQMYPSFLDGLAADRDFGGTKTSVTEKIDTFTMPRSANQYKNAKTLQYPYCKLVATNGVTEQDFVWEDFTYSDATFYVHGQLFPATEIKMYPIQYKGRTYNYAYAIDSPDYPTVVFSEDSWAAWYNINGSYTNQQMIGKAIGAIGMIGLSAAMGDVESIAKVGVTEELNLMETNQQLKQQRATPDKVYGSVAKGNLQFLVQGNTGFSLIEQRLYPDELKAIDDYFTRFGYAVNKVKVPNYTGRTYWNYVKIGDVLANGSVPTKYMEKINNALLSGVTIWHSHDNIGNFALNNDL